MSLIEVPGYFAVDVLNGRPGFAIANDGAPIALSATHDQIEFQRYERDGTLVESSIHDNGSATQEAGPIDVVALTNGSIAGLYARSNVGGLATRIYAADGTPLTDYQIVPRVAGAAQTLDQNFWLSANPSGGFSVMVGADHDRKAA